MPCLPESELVCWHLPSKINEYLWHITKIKWTSSKLNKEMPGVNYLPVSFNSKYQSGKGMINKGSQSMGIFCSKARKISLSLGHAGKVQRKRQWDEVKTNQDRQLYPASWQVKWSQLFRLKAGDGRRSLKIVKQNRFSINCF